MSNIKMTNEDYATFKSNLKFLIANNLVTNMIKRVPVDKGLLRQSIRWVKEGDSIGIKILDYGKYVEWGTPPHVIYPKNAKALHWKSGGKDVFAKVVHHPGTRAQPFIRPSFRDDLPRDLPNLIRGSL